MDALEIGLCWGTVRRAGLIDMIELAARHGFPTLEVPPHIYDAAIASGATAHSLRLRLRDGGVRVQVIDCIAAGMPGMPDGPTYIDGLAIRQYSARDCIDIADALDAPIVNVSLYRSRPVALPEMAAAIGAICRQAGADRTVVLEFYPESGIGNLHQAHAIARHCGEPNCRVMLDCWHLARSGGVVSDIEALPPGAIGALQLSDRHLPAGSKPYVPMAGRKLPGEGELPLAALVSAVLANSPGLSAEVEVFDDELNAMSLDAAAKRTASAVRAWRSSATCA